MTSTLDGKGTLLEHGHGAPPEAPPGNGATLLDGLGFSWTDGQWFLDLDATEERCRAYLELVRWPDGVLCPRCESHEVGRIESRKKFYCRSCRYQFSVTAQTIFHNSHLPLWKWFLTIFLMLQSEAGFPANRLVDLLGGSYKTAWFALHRVRAAIEEETQRSRACESPDACACQLEGVEATGEGDGSGTRVFERPFVGPYHQTGAKYVGAYLAELEWRSQCRDKPSAFRDTVHALVHTEPLAYADLVGRPGGDGRGEARVSPS
jgi:transposase-like protein